MSEERTIGRYEVLRVLGRGGMAVVYLARQTDLGGRLVALKELSELRIADPSFAHRFVRESRLAGSLTHPNIVVVHEYLEHDDTPYIAMEYVPGGSLRPYLGSLTDAQIAGVLEGLLAGLAHGESAGVVHRDIKPENLMVTDEGRIKITDFGIARASDHVATAFMTATGTTVGTPAYMAPEQAMGENIGPWTDLYACGTLAYEMLGRRLPFPKEEAPMATLMRRLNEDPPHLQEVRDDVDPAVADWVMSMLERDPTDRPRTADRAWRDLEDILIDVLGPRWRREARLPREPGTREAKAPLTPAPFDSTRTPTPEPSETVSPEGDAGESEFVSFAPPRAPGAPPEAEEEAAEPAEAEPEPAAEPVAERDEETAEPEAPAAAEAPAGPALDEPTRAPDSIREEPEPEPTEESPAPAEAPTEAEAPTAAGPVPTESETEATEAAAAAAPDLEPTTEAEEPATAETAPTARAETPLAQPARPSSAPDTDADRTLAAPETRAEPSPPSPTVERPARRPTPPADREPPAQRPTGRAAIRRRRLGALAGILSVAAVIGVVLALVLSGDEEAAPPGEMTDGPEVPAEAEVEGEPIPVDGTPVGVAVDDDRVFVATRSGRELVELNRQGGEEGSAAIDSNTENVVIEGDFAWVTLRDEEASGTLAEEVAAVPLDGGEIQRVTVGTEPRGIATDGEGTLFVTSDGAPGEGGTVSSFDADPAAEPSISDPDAAGQDPHGILVHDGRLWITDRESGQVFLLDPDRLERRGSPIEVGANPKGIALAEDQNQIFVANTDERSVSVIDAESLQVLEPLKVGGMPRGVAAGFGSIWVANGAGWVDRIDPETLDVVQRRIEIPDLPGQEDASPEELAAGAGHIWVTTGSGNSVVRIDPDPDG